MRWKRISLSILLLLAVLGLGLLETKRHLIPILSAGNTVSVILWILLIAAAVSAVGRTVFRALGSRKPLLAERGQTVCGFGCALSVTALLFVYECVKGRIFVSAVFAVGFLVCLAGAVSACSFSIRIPRRRTEAKPGVLRLSAVPDGDRLTLRYQGSLRKKDGRRDDRLEAVSGETSVPLDFFWDRDADRVAGAVRRLLPSVALMLSPSECRVADPTGDETELTAFLPYRYVQPEPSNTVSLTGEADLMQTECVTDDGPRAVRYSVGSYGGRLYLHSRTDDPAGDAYFRLPDAFFFRDSEQTVRTELRDWARSADVQLFAAIRSGRGHAVHFPEDFQTIISSFGYAQPEALSRADYTPLQPVPFPHIPLMLEQPVMITKPDEGAPYHNVYRIGLAKRRLYLHSTGDNQDDWGDWDTRDHYFMLADDFFHSTEAHIRHFLIETALGSERALSLALDSPRQQPTVRFSKDFSAITARFREMEPYQPKQLEGKQEKSSRP